MRLAKDTFARGIYPDTGQHTPMQILAKGTPVRDVVRDGPGARFLASHDGGKTWYLYKNYEGAGVELEDDDECTA